MRQTFGHQGRHVQADVVLASQFSTTLHQQVLCTTGERRLLMAMLENAVHCFQKYLLSRNEKNRQLYEEATRWIMEDRPSADSANEALPFSFTYVCEALGLEPSCLRRGLEQWRERELERARRKRTAT